MEIGSDSFAAIPPIQRRVTLVKDEIDDLKHRVQPLRQFLWRRYLVWNRSLSNLCLCAHNALRQGRRRNQKRPGNLLRGQAAISRMVSATCPSGGRAGWQQVKIRRRLSSSRLTSSLDLSAELDCASRYRTSSS